MKTINFDHVPTDLIVYIALELGLPDIIKWCQVSKKFNTKICNNDMFWQQKFLKEFEHFGNFNIPASWYDLYKRVETSKPKDLLWEGINTDQLGLIGIGLSLGADLDDQKIIVENIISSTKKVEWVNLSLLPLTKAVKMENFEMVKYLLEHGADVNSIRGQALRYANLSGNLKMIKLLEEHGAYVDVYRKFQGKTGRVRSNLSINPNYQRRNYI